MRSAHLLLPVLLCASASAPVMKPYVEPSFAVRGSQGELFAALRRVAEDRSWELAWAAPRRGELEGVEPREDAAPIRWRFRVERDRVAVRMEYLAPETTSWTTPAYIGDGHDYPDESKVVRSMISHLAGQRDDAALLASR